MQGNQSNIPPTIKDEITLKEILLRIGSLVQYLLGRWKRIGLIALTGGALGLAYSFLKKPTYTGQLSFVLESSGKSGVSSYAGIAAQFGLNLGMGGGGIFQDDENIMALMRSRNMIGRALLAEDADNKGKLLVHRYMDFSGLSEEWKNHPKLSKLKFHTNPAENDVLEDSVLNILHEIILKENLFVEKQDKKTDIVSITTIATDERFSKYFTEELLREVTSFFVETQTKKSAENVNILRKQVDSVRGFLNNALTGVARSTDANPNPNPAFQSLRVPSQRGLVDVEMNKAILEELVKHLELAEITLRKETPLVQVIDKPIFPLKEKKVGKLKGTAAGMFLGGLLAALFISIRLFFKKVLA